MTGQKEITRDQSHLKKRKFAVDKGREMEVEGNHKKRLEKDHESQPVEKKKHWKASEELSSHTMR